MNKLILPFLNPSLFQCGDKPMVWREALPNPTQYVNWDTVTHCFNNPWYYRTQLMNMEGRRLMLPEKFEVWYETGVPHKEELFHALNEGHTFIIEQYGHYNPAVDNLLENIEAMFDCNCDAHIFFSVKKELENFLKELSNGTCIRKLFYLTIGVKDSSEHKTCIELNR